MKDQSQFHPPIALSKGKRITIILQFLATKIGQNKFSEEYKKKIIKILKTTHPNFILHRKNSNNSYNLIEINVKTNLEHYVKHQNLL